MVVGSVLRADVEPQARRYNPSSHRLDATTLRATGSTLQPFEPQARRYTKLKHYPIPGCGRKSLLKGLLPPGDDLHKLYGKEKKRPASAPTAAHEGACAPRAWGFRRRDADGGDRDDRAPEHWKKCKRKSWRWAWILLFSPSFARVGRRETALNPPSCEGGRP